MASFVRSGQVRLVSRTTANLRTGSIQSEVPAYPRCPIDSELKNLPDDDGGVGVSQPRARVVP